MNEKVKAIGDEWVAALPQVYTQVQRAIDDPETSFQDIGAIIANDTALTSKLLRLVNSSFYGFSENVETITHALNIVGTSQLNDLILATSVTGQFTGISKDLVSMDSFWQHSIAVGLAARELAEDMSVSEPERFYVAGMLHDIGSLVIFTKMPKRSKDVLDKCRASSLPLYEEEQKSFGFDHASVGEALLKAWEIPNRLVEAVAYHHNPAKAKRYQKEASIIHVADFLAYEMKLGSSGVTAAPPMDPGAWDLMGLPGSTLDTIKHNVEEKFNDTVSMLLSK